PGEEGERGERGRRGKRGHRGYIGERGPRGKRGHRGRRGEDGDPGEMGPQGPEGIQGPQGEQGDPGEQGERGRRGKRGHRGRKGRRGDPGPSGELAQCPCIRQVRNVLEQIIDLFPTSTITVNYENSGSASGIPAELLPEGNDSSIFVLENCEGTIIHRIDICKIASIVLGGTDSFIKKDGSIKIKFLEEPLNINSNNNTDFEANLRRIFTELAETGREVTVRAGGVDLEEQPVIISAYGVTLLGCNALVSNCYVEDIK
ncbi:Collagen triple helix repeat protein, partial [Clostridium carboxidivorans P7]